MKVRRVGFVGIRSDKNLEMAAFLRDVMGLETADDDPDQTFSRLPTNRFDFVETFSRAFDDPRLCHPEAGDVFVGFTVDDVASAYDEMVAAGIDVLGPVIDAAAEFDVPSWAGLAWFWIRAPDGNVYAIQQMPD